MRQSRQVHRSFGSVARAALAHPEWPKGARPQARSLASLLSKIDRGLELEWLADRPAVQHVLAEVLSTPRATIASVVGVATAANDEGRRRLRLDDLPFGSPLDLVSEPLPPGIPEAVRRPSTWSRTWWLAPSGSGRSLAGAWLAARGLATVITAPELRADDPRYATTGPVFVELWSDAGNRDARAPCDAICVAAPFLPSAETASAWTVIESEPPSVWIEALVSWISRRLPRDGHFVPLRALEWLRGAIASGAIDGLGSALGLAGVIDQYGVVDIERRGLSHLAERFVKDRVHALAGENGPDTEWLAEHGTEVLGRIGARLLTDSEDAWDAPRSFEEWVRLVPPEYREAVDAEWVRWSLSQSASPPTVKEIERALRELSPGAFRVVRALERAGLLRRTHGDRLALGPRWLAERTLDMARAELVRGAPEGWGEAMLAPRSAGPTLQAIRRRVADGDEEVLGELLELDNPRSPEHIAAFETGFRVAGIAVLEGTELSADVVLGLWAPQVALLVEHAGVPHPRVDHEARSADEEPLLHVGAFHLAALALSELLPEGSAAHHPLLRPWGGARPGLFAAVLDSIWSVVKRMDPDRSPWALEAYAMVDRIASSFTAPESDEPPAVHALEWPGRVLDAIERDSLTADLVNAGSDPVRLRALLALGRRRGTSPRAIVHATWHACAGSPAPVDARSPLSPASPLANVFYADAPPRALSALLGGGHVVRAAIPYDALPEDTWRELLESGCLDDNPAAIRALPATLVADAILRTALADEALAALWDRAPEAVDASLHVSLSRGTQLARRLVSSAPPSRTGVVVARLRTAWLDGPDRENRLSTVLVKELLHERVTARVPGWRDAFELLAEIP